MPVNTARGMRLLDVSPRGAVAIAQLTLNQPSVEPGERTTRRTETVMPVLHIGEYAEIEYAVLPVRYGSFLGWIRNALSGGPRPPRWVELSKMRQRHSDQGGAGRPCSSTGAPAHARRASMAGPSARPRSESRYVAVTGGPGSTSRSTTPMACNSDRRSLRTRLDNAGSAACSSLNRAGR